MSTAPQSFVDPDQRPSVFDPVEEKPITLYGQTGFPISFAIDELPREASLLTLTAKHSDIFYADKDVYTSSDIVQNVRGEALTFELYADGGDVSQANFNLRVPKKTGGYYFNPCGDLIEIRQPTMSSDAVQTFSMTASTQTFSKYLNLYPTATLRLTFSSHLDNATPPWPPAPFDLPDKTATSVTVAPKDSNGILDIVAEVRIKWYTDSQRKNPYGGSPPFSDVGCSYGLRFYVTKGGDFLERCQITGGGGVVSEVYPTSYLSSIGQPPMSLYYWVGGTLGSDIYDEEVASIVVSDNGLPMQGLPPAEVGVYVLPNPLPDTYSSSSSVSSSSVVPSMSSSSFSSSTSTYWSGWSTSSLSSSSSSSTKTMSSSKSSSSSSSTAALPSSSSSSLGYESSFSEDPVLWYPFSTKPLAGEITDASSRHNDAAEGDIFGLLVPPEWGASYGVFGGGFKFSASPTSSSYIQGLRFSGISGCTRGTVSMWIKPIPGSTPVSVPFCISNGFVAVKTELAVRLDSSAGTSTVTAYLTIQNAVQWSIASSPGILPDSQWSNIVLTHNGRTPKLFINGVEDWTTVQSLNKRRWMKDIFSNSVPSDMMILGGVPRYYQPFIALGFNGYMDEITIWDVPLSANRILDAVESSSSSSSSTS